MMVLSRQKDESVMIGGTVEVTIIDIRGDRVRLGITSPKYIPVHRREIYDAIQREKAEAEKSPVGAKTNPEENGSVKTRERSFFSCSGAYGSNNLGREAYIEVSASEKKLDCASLNSSGYCCFENEIPSKECPFGIEKLV